MTNWSEILTEHGDLVWRTVNRVLRHHADATDCYQETIIEAWQFVQKGPIKNWPAFLTCLATRRAINRLRQRALLRVRCLSLETVPEPFEGHSDPSQSAHLAELIDRVRADIARLPEKQAEAVWLSCVEGWSNQEIADQIGIAVGEVRVLVHRGRTHLIESLGAEFIER
jgi:RNA polymerase sigma-70 factor (ECF subfamily)